MDETMTEHEHQGQTAILCAIDGQFHSHSLFSDIVDNFATYVYHMYIALYDPHSCNLHMICHHKGIYIISL